jgi:hypothetical protein
VTKIEGCKEEIQVKKPGPEILKNPNRLRKYRRIRNHATIN